MSVTILEQRALEVVENCELIGSAIAKQADLVSKRHRRLRAVNIVVGAAAALTALSQPISDLLGSSATQIIGVIAAVVLMIDGILPSLIHEESPDRLRDYVFYLRGFSGMIKNALAEEGVTEVQRRARVIALVELAEMNRADVCAKFEFLNKEADAIGRRLSVANKALEPTTTAVTSPTAQETRQL